MTWGVSEVGDGKSGISPQLLPRALGRLERLFMQIGNQEVVWGERMSSVLDKMNWGIQMALVMIWSPEERAGPEVVNKASSYSLTTL